MSILGDLDSLILRDTSHPPLTNKGSELTYAELDARATAIYDAIQSIVYGGNVTAYDAGATYDQYDTDIYKRYAGYNSRIWKAIYAGSPSTFSGQTPAEGVYWTQVSFAEMFQDPLAAIDDVNNCVCIKSASLTIATADVLTLNSVPLTIVGAVAGYAIEVISASATVNFNTTAYATNVNLTVGCSGAVKVQAAQIILSGTVSATRRLSIQAATAVTDTQLIANADLNVSVATGDPTAGDSDITVNVIYQLIQI